MSEPLAPRVVCRRQREETDQPSCALLLTLIVFFSGLIGRAREGGGGGPASKRPRFERVASDVDLAAVLFIDVNIFVDTMCYIIYYYIW